MKIVEAVRNEENHIVFILDDGSEIFPSNEYIQENKPQIGDEWLAEVPKNVEVESPAEVAKTEEK